MGQVGNLGCALRMQGLFFYRNGGLFISGGTREVEGGVNGAWILEGWAERANTLRGHCTAELAARPKESSGSFSFRDALDILSSDVRSAI